MKILLVIRRFDSRSYHYQELNNLKIKKLQISKNFE